MINHIGVELANKAREVIVLEIFRKQIPSENGRVPNDKSGSVFVPRNHIVNGA